MPLAALLALAGCHRAPPPRTEALQAVAVGAPVDALLVDDVDGDGRPDLAVTSHGASFTQIFYQRAARSFQAGPRVTVLGFHPWGLVRVPGAQRLYLGNAEGTGRLVVLRPEARGGLAELGALRVPQPRSTSLVRWQGWGLSAAVTPYAATSVTLLRDLDAAKATAGERYQVEISRRGSPGAAAVAELRRGEPVLVLASPEDNAVFAIARPREGEPPKADLLWRFQAGWPQKAVPFDGHGAQDLAVPLPVTRVIALLMNDGQGNLKAGEQLSFPGSGPVDVAAGTDRDGSRYLLAGGNPGLVLYRLGKGGAEARSVPFGRTAYTVALIDLDGDGWLDAVIGARGRKIEDDAVWILYGPLWSQAAKLAGAGPPAEEVRR